MIPVRRWNRLAGGSGAQIPFRRAAALRGSQRPCLSAQMPSRGAKRKYSPLSSWGARRARGGDKEALSGRSLPPPPPHSNNRWGAKRVRSALGCGGQPAVSVRSLGCGGGNPALSVGSLPRLNNDCSPCTDWANLGDGPAGLIAEFTLARDLADYVRFRAACRSWRRCSPDPRAGALDGRFLPRQWIMLEEALGPQCRRFLNTSTGECIRMDLPELAEHRLLGLTPEGLLLLLHEPTLVARLLNPFTCQLTDLPPVTGLLSPELRRARHCDIQMGELILVYGTGLVADGAAVAVSFCDPKVLAIAKPGDKSWTRVDNSDTHMYSVLPFAGCFYCVSSCGVMVLKFSSDQQQPPRLVTVAEWSKSLRFSRMADSLHLVDNGGELLLVHRVLVYCDYDQDEEDGEGDGDGDGDGGTYVRKYEVYRVDLDAGILIPAKGLNGRALFMSMNRAISVPAADTFPFATPNTIYLGVDCDRQTREYNVADGSMEPWLYHCLIGPDTAVDCLRFCI